MGAKKGSPLLGLLAAMTVFGTVGIFVRLIPLPSGVIALFRGTIGTLVLLPVVLIKGWRRSFRGIGSNLVTLCLSGVFLGANWIMLFEAYRHTSVATATLCYYMAPVIVIMLSPLLFGERLTLTKIMCTAVAIAGMVLVSGVLRQGGMGRGASGILYGLGAAVLYAGVVVLNKRLKNVSVYGSTLIQLAVCAAVLLPFVLLVDGTAKLSFAPLTVVLLVAVGVAHTGVTYTLYFGSVSVLKAQTVAIFAYLDPVVAVLLSALVLKEKLGVVGIAGAVLILGSTLLCSLADARFGES